MARSWFTTKPDKYFLRVPRRGHRNEVAFAIFGNIQKSCDFNEN